MNTAKEYLTGVIGQLTLMAYVNVECGLHYQDGGDAPNGIVLSDQQKRVHALNSWSRAEKRGMIF